MGFFLPSLLAPDAKLAHCAQAISSPKLVRGIHMPYSTKVIDKKDYLLCIIGGEATSLEDIIAHAEFLVIQARKFNQTRLLLDETALVMKIGRAHV